MFKLNSKGFGIIEGLLAIVIIGLIAGGGFYVYKSNNNVDSNLNKVGDSEPTASSDIEKTEKKEEQRCVAQADQSVYTNTDLGFCYIYSAEWGKTPKLAKADGYKVKDGIYGPEIRYSASNGTWFENKQAYRPDIHRKDKEFTVYGFGGGDGGCGFKRMYFVIKDKMVIISSPVGCNKEIGAGGGTKLDIKEIEEQAELIYSSLSKL